MIEILAAVVWLASAFFTAAVAQAKGHNGTMWFLGGLGFGLIALIAACGMPDRAGAS